MKQLHNLQCQMKSVNNSNTTTTTTTTTTTNSNNNNNNNENKENSGVDYDWIREFEVNRLLKRQIEPQIEDLLMYQSSLQLIEKIKMSKTFYSSPLSSLKPFYSSTQTRIDDHNEVVDVEKVEEIIKATHESINDDDDDDLFLCKPDEEELQLFKTFNEYDISEIDIEGNYKDKQPTDSGLLQIIYCSRTHSQLNQIAKEFNKCKTLFNKITMIQLSSRHLLCINQQIYQLKHSDLINIGCLELNRDQGQSKKFKCPMRNISIVNNLTNHLLIGNSALDITNMIRDKHMNNTDNTMKKAKLNESNISETEDNIALLSHIGCPYYANRKGIPLAQLILIPYSLLLQPISRLTSGLKLKNSIIIIDEAHNLLEAMASSMSVNLLLMNDLNKLEELFNNYLTYYRSRLSTRLALRLRQMKYFIQKLKVYLDKILENIQLSISSRVFMSTSSNILIKTVNKLFSETNLDNVNISELIECLEYQHFIMKLIGFSKWMKLNSSETISTLKSTQLSSSSSSQLSSVLASMKRKCAENKNEIDDVNQVRVSNKRYKLENEKSEGIGSSLFKFHSFLQALASCEEDARIVIEPVKNSTKLDNSSAAQSTLLSSPEKDIQDLCLRVIFLNPGRYLKELVQEAKSVLLVGGTMQPFDEAIEQIFIPAGKLSNQIVTFTCDHVIDAKTQLCVYPLGESCQSYGNVLPLDFTYQKRSDPIMIDACGEIVLQICQQLPAGIVIFTPSYEYQSTLYHRWEATGLLNKLSKYKSLFHEPKTTGSLDQIMQAYGIAATQKLQQRQGALLLCVIGGKLSEGINFTDDLARVVIIIGMPYANPQSPLLREKMAYLDRHFTNTILLVVLLQIIIVIITPF
ncbi:unnamed protein product [Heterobilharzia americana]|nr:unnamed protein product [Heterobilharzia americana]